MTAPSAKKIEQEQDKLLVTDAELIRRLGVPEKIGRLALKALDEAPSGFPRKQKLWGDRRYWPAVLAYLEHTGGRLGGPQLLEESRHG